MGANERDPRWSMTALFSTFLHRYHFMLVWQLGQTGGTTRCSTPCLRMSQDWQLSGGGHFGPLRWRENVMALFAEK